MKKIIIAGPVGAGKTTLSKLLSKKLSIPHIELDHIYWLPGWQVRPVEERIKIASEKISPLSKWIVCGNHSYLKDVIWNNADTVIWLDYSFWRCFFRALKRAFNLIYTKKEICGGNRESFFHLFFSKKSILVYLVKGYRKLKKRYSNMMNSPEYKHLTFVHLRSPKETEKWLGKL
jgi:adenylate kinase family enzyme